MAVTEEGREALNEELRELSDEEIAINIANQIYGNKKWKYALAERELERRKEQGEVAKLNERVSKLESALTQNKIMVGAAVLAAFTAVLSMIWNYSSSQPPSP